LEGVHFDSETGQLP